ncbi:hypothetical protein BGZ76_007097, partial [Entomortierella beljakovae]
MGILKLVISESGDDDDYKQESVNELELVRAKEYLPWVLDQDIVDRVSFAAFVQKFRFIDLEDAKLVYEILIRSHILRKDRRQLLLARYQGFLRNSLQSFWSSHLLRLEKQDTKTEFRRVVTKSAREVQSASMKEIAENAESLECKPKSKRIFE